MSPARLTRAFFAQQAETVARMSLGKTLVRHTDQGLLIGIIVETEAYLGEHDPASHTSSGRTPRTAVLYGEPGHAYTFQIHGHTCLNFAAEPLGSPGCVLIRALQPVEGLEAMRAYRGRPDLPAGQIANGPGKLCRAFNITSAMYGLDLVDAHSPLQVCEALVPEAPVVAVSTRIGITKAADWGMRFTLAGNPYVSR